MCRDISNLVREGSEGKIELLPLLDQRAGRLLKRFYPRGYPFSYFLIEDNNGHARLWEGQAAAFRLARYLPFLQSLGVLSKYLQYKARAYHLTRKMAGMQSLRTTDKVSDGERRTFIRTLLVGSIALSLGYVSMYRIAERDAVRQLNPLGETLLLDGQTPRFLLFSPSGELILASNDKPSFYSSNCECPAGCCCPNYACYQCCVVGPNKVACFACCCNCSGYKSCELVTGDCGSLSPCHNAGCDLTLCSR